MMFVYKHLSTIQAFRISVEEGQKLNLKNRKTMGRRRAGLFCCVIGKLNAFPPSPLNQTVLHTYVYM